ncbi:hypothetical protein WJX75_003367 [Coccomyxa subellipsoidea]|uniref:Uncharacterized protein n=1 Tax=Coccomyxa subellipsoidea TaxID=248742 RepID=A0ABR2YES9_9CHLO
MEGSKDTINGPVTPFKAMPKAQIKESSGTPHRTSSGIQRDPVSGLFASPTFVTKIAGSTEKERDCAAGDPVAISNTNAEDAETLAQFQ